MLKTHIHESHQSLYIQWMPEQHQDGRCKSLDYLVYRLKESGMSLDHIISKQKLFVLNLPLELLLAQGKRNIAAHCLI